MGERDLPCLLTVTDTAGTVEIRVMDISGKAVPNADVYVNLSTKGQKIFVTDEQGQVRLTAIAGTYRLVAFRDGYSGAELDFTVGRNRSSTVEVRMHKGSMMAASFTSHRMTLEEMMQRTTALQRRKKATKVESAPNTS